MLRDAMAIRRGYQPNRILWKPLRSYRASRMNLSWKPVRSLLPLLVFVCLSTI